MYPVETFSTGFTVAKGDLIAIRADRTGTLRCGSGGDHTWLFDPPLLVGGSATGAVRQPGLLPACRVAVQALRPSSRPGERATRRPALEPALATVRRSLVHLPGSFPLSSRPCWPSPWRRRPRRRPCPSARTARSARSPSPTPSATPGVRCVYDAGGPGDQGNDIDILEARGPRVFARDRSERA